MRARERRGERQDALGAWRAVERHEQPAQADIADPLTFGSVCGDDEHRAAGARDDHQGRAAESPSGESPLAVAREDDEIDVLRPGEVDDLLGGPSLEQGDCRRELPRLEVVVDLGELAQSLRPSHLPVHRVVVVARRARDGRCLEDTQERHARGQGLRHRDGPWEGTRGERRPIQRYEHVADGELMAEIRTFGGWDCLLEWGSLATPGHERPITRGIDRIKRPDPSRPAIRPPKSAARPASP